MNTLNESFTTQTNTASKTQSQNCVQKYRGKIDLGYKVYAAWVLEHSCSRIAQMSILNGSPNQALQERHAHLRASRSFPRDNWVFEPKLPYPDLCEKMWKRDTVWEMDPKSGQIMAANKHIKQTRLKNHSQLKFTPSLLQRDSAPSLHERPYPSLRSYFCAPSPA